MPQLQLFLNSALGTFLKLFHKNNYTRSFGIQREYKNQRRSEVSMGLDSAKHNGAFIDPPVLFGTVNTINRPYTYTRTHALCGRERKSLTRKHSEPRGAAGPYTCSPINQANVSTLSWSAEVNGSFGCRKALGLPRRRSLFSFICYSEQNSKRAKLRRQWSQLQLLTSDLNAAPFASLLSPSIVRCLFTPGYIYVRSSAALFQRSYCFLRG